MSWPDDQHRAEPHGHVHIEDTGEHAHTHTHGREEHSHMHVHVQEGAHPLPDRHSELLREEDDDEIGYLVTNQQVHPREIEGKHCKWCGEYVELRPTRLPHAYGPYVIEYQHVATQMVHCDFAWANGNLVGLAEETAQPCFKAGCLSNAEHEARQLPAQGEEVAP